MLEFASDGEEELAMYRRYLLAFGLVIGLMHSPFGYAQDGPAVHVLMKDQDNPAKEAAIQTGSLVDFPEVLKVEKANKQADEIETQDVLYLIFEHQRGTSKDYLIYRVPNSKKVATVQGTIFKQVRRQMGNIQQIDFAPFEDFKLKVEGVRRTLRRVDVKAIYFDRGVTTDKKEESEDKSIDVPNKEAFHFLPSVRPVLPRRPSAPDSMVPQGEFGSLIGWARAHGIRYFEKRFDQPAHFPLPKVGLLGERWDEGGLVLHEGMRFIALADGQFEVSLTVSTPSMPVTLRLQLAVVDQFGQSFSLTLPPIDIEPFTDFRGNYAGQSFQCRHTGFSQAVAEAFPNLGLCTLCRQGTARFGSWPEGINRFGAPPQAVGLSTTSGSSETGSAPSMP